MFLYNIDRGNLALIYFWGRCSVAFIWQIKLYSSCSALRIHYEASLSFLCIVLDDLPHSTEEVEIESLAALWMNIDSTPLHWC